LGTQLRGFADCKSIRRVGDHFGRRQTSDIDILVEDYAEKLNQKAQKEIEKAKKRFGEAFDEAQVIATNDRVNRYLTKRAEILERLGRSLTNEDLADVKALIEELEIADPDTGSRNWTDVRQFNLMFKTQFGAVSSGDGDDGVCRVQPGGSMDLYATGLRAVARFAFWPGQPVTAGRPRFVWPGSVGCRLGIPDSGGASGRGRAAPVLAGAGPAPGPACRIHLRSGGNPLCPFQSGHDGEALAQYLLRQSRLRAFL
jgi:hypothetical protein